MRNKILLCFLFIVGSQLFAQNTPPALNQIKVEDLKNDLEALAGVNFKGRSAGTLDELRAAMWLGEKYRKIGLKPSGDDGTYFQFFTLWRNQISEQTNIEINNKKLALWQDVSIAQMANINLNGAITYLGSAVEIDTNSLDIKGKIVALEANPKGINLNVSLPTWRYSRYIYTKYGAALVRRGAVAIIFIADETAENAWNDANENFKIGNFDIDGGVNVNLTTKVPVLWLHQESKKLLEGRSASLNAKIVVSKYAYPSVNIVGKVEGTDANLKSEYLLYSGHTDAHGIRNEIKGDSICYGADDNGSVNVAMLSNARAFVKNPAKRSVLFVIHGAEEKGLLGSKYYSSHSTVPIGNIVAVLNGDMIGRNHIDSATVLGAIPPHRNSSDLIGMTMEANKEGPNFKLDYTWDDVKHIEGWYFRSDHLPYASLGIPALMYTTLLHPDYHTPQDNVENINFPKLKKMADWMYRTGWKVANTKQRPATDKNFKLER